jgi:putative tricarboxylic transport membrane protein
MGVNVTWASFRGYYMGREAPKGAYDFYVEAFKRAHLSTEFAKIRNEKGLFEFSLAGDAFHLHVQGQVTQLRQLVNDAGLRQ